MSEFLKLKQSNCKNCYKCIRHCPVKSIRFSAGQAHIVSNECILCGQCFVVCPQNAKEIADDTEKVKVMIAQGPVVASIAPSFVANYNGIGIESMEAALKQLGFTAAEETALGATVVKNRYDEILRGEKPDVLISSCCHSLNLLIQKHFPGALSCLADVLSPMQAHCKDLKERYPGAQTVFIGPCVAKKDEAAHYEGIVDGVLTFEQLSRMFSEAGIDLQPQPEAGEKGKARLFPITGGILKSMACDQPDYTYLAIDGVENCMAALRDIERGQLHKCFIEMSVCTGSCIGGPVMEKYHRLPVHDYQEVSRYAGKEDFTLPQPEGGALHKALEPIGRKLPLPTSTEIAAILRQMGKQREKDELNCGSCGYNTCREKAIAIYQGKADLTMCLPFLKDRAESFSDTIIHNTPNGIFVLNENLEVQQINRAACEILNIRYASDVLGEPVIRIMDPTRFAQVKNNGAKVRDERAYLPEYKKHVEQTILYDREYRVLICILRDVTKEETARLKKEDINRQTIEVADNVVDKQMRIVQEIASLLGETAAETKIALSRLKESIRDE